MTFLLQNFRLGTTSLLVIVVMPGARIASYRAVCFAASALAQGLLVVIQAQAEVAGSEVLEPSTVAKGPNLLPERKVGDGTVEAAWRASAARRRFPHAAAILGLSVAS